MPCQGCPPAVQLLQLRKTEIVGGIARAAAVRTLAVFSQDSSTWPRAPMRPRGRHAGSEVSRPNSRGVGRLSELRPTGVARIAPEFAVLQAAAGMMPSGEQAVAEHGFGKKQVRNRRMALDLVCRTAQAHVESSSELQPGGNDFRLFPRLHEGRGVAYAGHCAFVDLMVEYVGGRDDGALLEIRNDVGPKKRIGVCMEFGHLGACRI